MADITSGQDVDIISPIGQTTMAASVSVAIASNQTAVPVSGTLSSKTALTASAPNQAVVGTSSAVAVASNASRKGLILVNTSTVNTISLAVGVAALPNQGITLLPGCAFSMDEFSFFTGEVRAIASNAGTTLSYQEFV